MKKLLIALLCFCFVIACFAFPAAAADTTEYKLYGVYYLNDTLTLSSGGVRNSGSFSSMTYKPYFGDGTLVNILYIGSFLSDYSDLYFSFNGPTTNGNVTAYSAASGWADDSYKTITFPVPTVVSAYFYECFSANYSSRNYPRECDGILHPITDTDYDGVCELCGDRIPDDLRPSSPQEPYFDRNINASYVYEYGAAASALSITASVTDGGTLSYQWYKNTTNSTFGGTAITGATSSFYTPDTTSSGTRYYYCKVTNTIGAVYTEAYSNVASVTVQAPTADTPVFDLDLPTTSFVYDQGAAAGSLTVSASVSDGGTLSYQWCKSSGIDVTSGTAISGATGPSFTPPTSDPGTYYYFCRVINSKNGVSSVAYSNVVMVKIMAPDPPEAPVFSLDLNPNYSYTVGDQAVSLKVSASVSDGGSLFYQWFMSSSSSISSGSPIAGANSVSYVPSTSAAGTTYYYCLVTNTLNGLTTEVYSTVAAVVVSDPAPVICDGSSHSPYDPDSDYTCNTCGCPILESLRLGYYNYRGHWLLAFPFFNSENVTDHAYLGIDNGIYFMAAFHDPLYVNPADNSVRFGSDGVYMLFYYDPDNIKWVSAGTFNTSMGDVCLDNAYSILWTKHDLLSSSGTVWIAGDPNFVVTEPDVPDAPGWTENESDTLWGWFSSIFDGLGRIWESITNLPGQIADLVLSGIKSLFVPDVEKMEEKFIDLFDKVNPSSYAGSSGAGGRWDSTVDNVFSNFGMIDGEAPNNVVGDIHLGDGLSFLNVTFADLSPLYDAVEYFRPVINGFLTFLIALFWFSQLLELIGQVPVSGGHDNKSLEPSGPITSHQYIDPGKGIRKL